MMKRFLTISVLIGACIGWTSTSAHHSFSATYDDSREQVIEGKIAQFLLRNPHSMVHVLARDEHGEEHRYAIEWAGVSGLTGAGITRTTLRIGDDVIVRGNPGRNASDYRLRMLSIDRPADGWHWGGTFE
jgi:hypothetical protein